MAEKCVHYWNYEHTVYQGRGSNGLRGAEVGIVRYCSKCGTKRMSFTKKWIEPPKEYDLSHVGK